MKVIGVIPARWASTRFDGKILAEISGKPMIQHVWERSNKSESLDDLIIACDDERILKVAEGFGAKAVMTSADHASGTERIAEAVEPTKADIIVNIQGDEPLIDHSVIDALAQILIDEEKYPMATAIKVIDDESDLSDPNVVKVVVDGEMNALYFSRAAIPYCVGSKSGVDFYKHLGIYAYRRELLLSYANLPKSNLEKTEKLEQLRALEYGYKIKAIVTDINTVGVDTPKDIAKVEAFLK